MCVFMSWLFCFFNLYCPLEWRCCFLSPLLLVLSCLCYHNAYHTQYIYVLDLLILSWLFLSLQNKYVYLRSSCHCKACCQNLAWDQDPWRWCKSRLSSDYWVETGKANFSWLPPYGESVHQLYLSFYYYMELRLFLQSCNALSLFTLVVAVVIFKHSKLLFDSLCWHLMPSLAQGGVFSYCCYWAFLHVYTDIYRHCIA